MNCKLESEGHFNKLTYNETTELDVANVSEIFKYLDERQKASREKNHEESKKETYDESVESNPEYQLWEDDENTEEERDLKNKDVDQRDPVDLDDSPCCPTHYRVPVEPRRNREVHEHFRDIRIEADKDLKRKVTVLIFEKELVIDRKRIEIGDEVILFNKLIPNVNFAGCWNGPVVEDCVSSKIKKVDGYHNIPPVLFHLYEEGSHLRVELFNNNFVRRVTTEITEYEIKDRLMIRH